MAPPFYYAVTPLSMLRHLFFGFCLLVGSGAALADTPKFSEGGVVFGLQYAGGFWGFDEPAIGSQIGAANAHRFVSDVQTAHPSGVHSAGIRLGYNIKGHATIEADIVATGWNLENNTRGGGGFASGVVGWHPLELVFINKPERPIPLDVSISFGAGYGIVGQTVGMDGLVLQWGMNAQWWFSRFFALGVFVRGTFMMWHNFYLDYDNKVSLPMPQGSGGSFWQPGVELLLRFGD